MEGEVDRERALREIGAIWEDGRFVTRWAEANRLLADDPLTADDAKRLVGWLWDDGEETSHRGNPD